MVYDYTHGRTILINGIPFDSTSVAVMETNEQPLPNAEELVEAGCIAHAQSHDVIRGEMPLLITRDFPNGTSHRILNIAIFSGNSSKAVHVNMNNKTVEYPPYHSEEILACNAPMPARNSSITGCAGTANFIITQNGRELWSFQATRPAAS